MNKPVNAQTEAHRRAHQALAPTPQQVVVRFFRRMKPQRVYPLVVELKHPGGDAGSRDKTTLRVRPFIPGAHVTPVEGELHPHDPSTSSTFYVTPLARGCLRDARVEVYHQGSRIQELPLGMKTKRGRRTLILAALTLIVPAILLYLTVYNNFSSTGPYTALAATHASSVPLQMAKADAKENLNGGAQDKAGPGGKANGKTQGPARQPEGDDKEEAPPRGGEAVPGAPPPGMGGMPPQPPAPKAKIEKRKGPVERVILTNVPEVPSVSANYESPKVTAAVASGIQGGYDMAHAMANDYFSFYVGVFLLALTLISLVTSQPRRGYRRGKPIVLAPANDSATETLRVAQLVDPPTVQRAD